MLAGDFFPSTDGSSSNKVEVVGARGEEWFTQSTHNVFLDSGDSDL